MSEATRCRRQSGVPHSPFRARRRARGSSVGALILAALTLLPALPAPGAAQDRAIDTGSLELEIGGRVQAQAAHSSVDEAASLDFLVRRARLTFDLTVNDRLSGRVQPEFSGGELSLKDAWVRLAAAPSFRVTAGQFKLPFDAFELASSTLLPIIERDGRIPGVDSCVGVGRVCSLSRFTEALGYSDRDVGVMADGGLGERVRYALSLTNGSGPDERAGNDAKSFTARVEVGVSGDLTLAGNVSVHDYVPDPLVESETLHAAAWGVDAAWGAFLDPGLQVLWGLVAGENWLADPLDPEDFLATQAVLSYYVPRGGGGVFEAWAPVARVSWGDPTGLDDDAGLLLTPGLMLYIQGRNAVGVNFDVYVPETGETEYSLKSQIFLHF